MTVKQNIMISICSGLACTIILSSIESCKANSIIFIQDL